MSSITAAAPSAAQQLPHAATALPTGAAAFPASASAESIAASATPGAQLPGFSRTRNGRRYKLVVVQQPSRARMCGFGDKDRRPLSPTLIVKLLIYDANSGRELHPSEVNTSLFFVTSDLCHPDDLMLGPRNILVHQGTAGPFANPDPGYGPPQPSPSINGSVMSVVHPENTVSPTHAHFDPHTQSNVFAIPGFPGTQSFSSIPADPYPANAPWPGANNSGTFFFSACSGPAPYGMPGVAATADPSSSLSGFVSSSSSSQLGSAVSALPTQAVSMASAPPPIATGMAGTYMVGEPSSDPQSTTFPGGMGSIVGAPSMVGQPTPGIEYGAVPGALPPPLGSSGGHFFHSDGSTSLMSTGALPQQSQPQAPMESIPPPPPPSAGHLVQSNISSTPATSTTTAPVFPHSHSTNPYGSTQGTSQELFHPPSLFPPGAPLASVMQTQALSSDNLTRNLVGSAVASANVLKDLDERVCIFFVLQDISVRTEGVYRIKLMFADLGLNGTVNRGISEALAETYTDAFVVYSPRKFPGMHDPTELSRKLVSQGVKIPVRSDRKKKGRRGTAQSADSAGTVGGGDTAGAEAGDAGPSASGAATAGEDDDVSDE